MLSIYVVGDSYLNFTEDIRSTLSERANGKVAWELNSGSGRRLLRHVWPMPSQHCDVALACISGNDFHTKWDQALSDEAWESHVRERLMRQLQELWCRLRHISDTSAIIFIGSGQQFYDDHGSALRFSQFMSESCNWCKQYGMTAEWYDVSHIQTSDGWHPHPASVPQVCDFLQGIVAELCPRISPYLNAVGVVTGVDVGQASLTFLVRL